MCKGPEARGSRELNSCGVQFMLFRVSRGYCIKAKAKGLIGPRLQNVFGQLGLNLVYFKLKEEFSAEYFGKGTASITMM